MDTEQLVRQTWESLAQGDLGALEAVLAPQARWRAVEDGPWNCESHAQIIEVMGQSLAHGLSGTVADVSAVGRNRAIVAFRPDSHDDPGAWPLDDGIRYLVLSTQDGLITELKGCADRRSALDYAAAAAA